MRRRPVGSGDRRGPGGSLGVRIRRRMGRLLFQSHAWLGFAACMPVRFAETQFFLKETNKQASKQGCMTRGREQLSSRRSRLENVSQHLCPVPPEFPTAAVDSADVEVISLSPSVPIRSGVCEPGTQTSPGLLLSPKIPPGVPLRPGSRAFRTQTEGTAGVTPRRPRHLAWFFVERRRSLSNHLARPPTSFSCFPFFSFFFSFFFLIGSHGMCLFWSAAGKADCVRSMASSRVNCPTLPLLLSPQGRSN